MLPSAALTFGSYGDFASVLSSAVTLWRTVAAIAGTSKELAILTGDIGTFAKMLQTAKATFDEAIDMPESTRNALGLALGRCHMILDDIKKKTDEYNKQLSRQPSSRYRLIRKPCAVLAWEIFGGKEGMEKLWARMIDQMHALTILTILSLRSDSRQRSNTLEPRNTATDVKEIKSTVDKIESRVYEPSKPMVYVTPFYFRGNNGEDTLPVAGLTIADFSELFEVLREGDRGVPPLDSNSMSSQLSHLHHTTLRSDDCECDIYPYLHHVAISFSWFFHPSGSPHQTPAILISPMSPTVVCWGKDVFLQACLVSDDPRLEQSVSAMRRDWTVSWKRQRADRATNSNPQGAVTLNPTEYRRSEIARTWLGMCISQSLKRIDTMFEWSFGQPVPTQNHRPAFFSMDFTGHISYAWFKQVGGHLGIPLQLLLSCKGDCQCDIIGALVQNASGDIVSHHDDSYIVIMIGMEGSRSFVYSVPPQWATRTRAELLRNTAHAFQKLFEQENREEYCGSIRPDDIVLLGCAYSIAAMWTSVRPIWSVRETSK